MLRRCKIYGHFISGGAKKLLYRKLSTVKEVKFVQTEITVLGQTYPVDEWTNITPNIQAKLGRNLHVTPYHPLSHIRQRIVDYFYKKFRNQAGNPIFSVYDNLSPVVTVDQNFGSLLVPKDHPSRNKSDCYYINEDLLLRAHTTAHQVELISSGLNNFLVIGDVYRRDAIDRVHYPVFHQVDAVRLCTAMEVFKNVKDPQDLILFEKGKETHEKQSCHTLESVKIMEYELKSTLVGLAQTIFGADIEYKWIDQYFPFTHPSWELEVKFNGQWIEILGCGIMRQEIIEKSGAKDQIGWAFGLGLERLAMCIYKIPDIRLFWTKDTGFLSQFKVDDPHEKIEYKAVSVYPQCNTDISFWLPEDGSYCSNDFYDIVRNIGGDIIEQIVLIDEFTEPKHKRKSHCYRIICRHMERTLTRREVNRIIDAIRQAVVEKLKVVVR